MFVGGKGGVCGEDGRNSGRRLLECCGRTTKGSSGEFRVAGDETMGTVLLRDVVLRLPIERDL